MSPLYNCDSKSVERAQQERCLKPFVFRYRSGPANKLNYSTVGSAADWARFKLGTRLDLYGKLMDI